MAAKKDSKIQEGTTGVSHIKVSENELTAIRENYPAAGRQPVFVIHDPQGQNKDVRWRVRIEPHEYEALQKLRYDRDGTHYVKRKWTNKMDRETAMEVGNAYGERRRKKAEARLAAKKNQKD